MCKDWMSFPCRAPKFVSVFPTHQLPLSVQCLCKGDVICMQLVKGWKIIRIGSRYLATSTSSTFSIIKLGHLGYKILMRYYISLTYTFCLIFLT